MEPPRPALRRPVVLVVEDEGLVRMFVTDVLEEAGFEVAEAENAEAGLLALHARPDVRVLFTDVNMPGRIDGLELARIARAQGGFKWLSQHGLCDWIGGTGPEPRQVSSSQGSFAACC